MLDHFKMPKVWNDYVTEGINRVIIEVHIVEGGVIKDRGKRDRETYVTKNE